MIVVLIVLVLDDNCGNGEKRWLLSYFGIGDGCYNYVNDGRRDIGSCTSNGDGLM